MQKCPKTFVHDCSYCYSPKKIAVQCIFVPETICIIHQIAVYRVDNVKLLITNRRQVVGYTKK